MRVAELFKGYTIREDGQVMSRFGRVLTNRIETNGYVRVEMAGRKYSIHRLLAQAFIPNPLNKPQVNHINGKPSDNSLSNLEWVTQSENQLHAYRIGLQKGYKKPTPMSPAHKAALCGSVWKGQKRIYHAGGMSFDKPQDAAAYFGFNRQTFYNRSYSEKHPSWYIEVIREAETNG